MIRLLCPTKSSYAFCSLVAFSQAISAQKRPIPPPTLLQIVKAEDERRWDNDLRKLLSDRNAAIRKRAALAAGRIGNEDSVTALTPMIEKDTDVGVRAMAAFALGEIESETAANALVAVLKNTTTPLKFAHVQSKHWARSPPPYHVSRKHDNANSVPRSSKR